MKKLGFTILFAAFSFVTNAATTNILLSSNAIYALILSLNTNASSTNIIHNAAGTGIVINSNSITLNTFYIDTNIVQAIAGSGAFISNNIGSGTNTILRATGNDGYMTWTNEGSYAGVPSLYFLSPSTNRHKTLMVWDEQAVNGGADMIWSPFHSGGGEMQWEAPAIAFGMGANSGNGSYTANRRLQLGIGEYHHGLVDLQFDNNAKAVDPLGYSVPLRFVTTRWEGGANLSTTPTFRGEAYDTNGNYGISFYPDFLDSMAADGTNMIGGTPSIRFNGSNSPGITVLSGNIVSPTYASFTNTWVTNTAIPYRTNLILLSTANTGCGFIGITGFPTNVEGYAQLTIKASGDIVFTNPVSVWTSDGLTNRTITNGTSMVIAIDHIPGIITQAALVRFSHP